MTAKQISDGLALITAALERRNVEPVIDSATDLDLLGAGTELASSVAELLELVAGDVNPVVLSRPVFAPLERALIHYLDVAEGLLDDEARR